MNTIETVFGDLSFHDEVMRNRLSDEVYVAWQKTLLLGESLSPDLADSIADAMKVWAMEKGATHYSHWFIPMTGLTAEKHDSFLTPLPNGRAVAEFSGKSLIKGESDASSFPSGGLRATFEARGYTVWDCTSPAFVKDGTLCIPTIFCAYTGEALDKKTPLLRSMAALSKSATAFLHTLGKTEVQSVSPAVGAEQEYFLVDKSFFDKRLDLLLCGRTLFGAPPPKGQEMDDHYYANLKQRVSDYMKDLDESLWRLGIPSKTKHNEVAPAQHELAPVFEIANIACDHNHLLMEVMQKVALRHNLVCLLHEKPYKGVNGSGKHNNYSLRTDSGENLMRPAKVKEDEVRFFLIIAAMMRATFLHSDLLRMSIATAGNDHRLGSNEAPPAIVSMFLGKDLMSLLTDYAAGKGQAKSAREVFTSGVSTMLPFNKDENDRNRTSPLAFTGNKFEFRMIGSSASCATSTTILNTIVAESLDHIREELSAGKSPEQIVSDIIESCGAIVFNGNNYSDEWLLEAKKRGLLNISNTVDAVACLAEEKNIALFTHYCVYSRAELLSRIDIQLESYIKSIRIEALTMVEMANKQIYPAALAQLNELLDSAQKSAAAAIDPPASLKALIRELSRGLDALDRASAALAAALKENASSVHLQAKQTRDKVLVKMDGLRKIADSLEGRISLSNYPIPTYIDMLFRV